MEKSNDLKIKIKLSNTEKNFTINHEGKLRLQLLLSISEKSYTCNVGTIVYFNLPSDKIEVKFKSSYYSILQKKSKIADSYFVAYVKKLEIKVTKLLSESNLFKLIKEQYLKTISNMLIEENYDKGEYKGEKATLYDQDGSVIMQSFLRNGRNNLTFVNMPFVFSGEKFWFSIKINCLSMLNEIDSFLRNYKHLRVVMLLNEKNKNGVI